jgi:hypothetical protein
VFCYSQDVILAEKESLERILIGSGEGHIQCTSNEEGFFSPNGPIVDGEGNLLFIETTNWTHLLRYSLGKFKTFQRNNEFLSGNEGTTEIQFCNQEGMSYYGGYLVFNTDGSQTEFDDRDFIKVKDRPKNSVSYVYPIPSGIIIEYHNPPVVFSLELSGGRVVGKRTAKETSSWLPTQPGGFTIGDDGFLYRNGILWSARKADDIAGIYLGKLMSGHNVYKSGEKYFRITNSTGELELVLEMPWATDEDKKVFRPYNFGLGPWGEFYCLIPPVPKMKRRGETSYPYWDEGESELVVVRNHLKYFGRLNDDGVRLRKEPTTSGEILGTYPAKTGFRILETGTKSETIGGQKNVWYKVRLLDGTEGWLFGAFVHNLYDGPNSTPPPWPNVPDW